MAGIDYDDSGLEFWTGLGQSIRGNLNKGKMSAVVEVLDEFSDFVPSEETAAQWHNVYPSGDKVHLVTDEEGTMRDSVAGWFAGYPSLFLIDSDYTWQSADTDEISKIIENL